MKLSDLVSFLNYLDQHDLEQCYINSISNCDNINKMIHNAEVLDRSFKDPIQKSFQSVDQSVQSFTQSIRELRQKIMYRIIELEKQYFADSTELFNNGFRNDTPRHIISRKITLTLQALDIFEQRLKIYTTWQHPGLVFRPVHLNAFHEIVALDPMYLVDTHEELLGPPTQQFTERYQRRVRNYIIDEYSEEELLGKLPRDQFGLVAAQNFLNFKPIELVYRILTEVFELLKPGGAFVFTYNNCDLAGPVKLVENHFTCYTPGRLIKQHAAKTGYVLNYEYNEMHGSSIMELGKPGHRISIRGGQTLAVIKDGVEAVSYQHAQQPSRSKKVKPPKPIDSGVTRYYTEQEQQEIRLSAVILGIDTEDNVNKKYSIENLERLVNDCLNKPGVSKDKFQKRLDKLIQKRNQK